MTPTTRPKAKSLSKSHPKAGVATDASLRGRGPAPGAPNAGRPPSILRDAYRQAAEARLPFLLDVVDGKVEASTADRLKAIDMLNKYGGMASVEVTVAPKMVSLDV
jgi:hypothetical protein